MAGRRNIGTFRDGDPSTLRRSVSAIATSDDSNSRAAAALGQVTNSIGGGVNTTANADERAWASPAPSSVWEAIDRLAAAFLAANPSVKL